MEIEEILFTFINQMAMKYGNHNSVVKIALEPPAFLNLIHDLQSKQYTSDLINYGELKICGVQFVARERDKF